MFKNFFKKKTKDRTSIGLKDLLPGDMVDFDLKTWNVAAKHEYDWDGDMSVEWQLKSSDDMIFLELEDDESDEFCLSRKISNSEIDSVVFEDIAESDEAPEEIIYNNQKFFLEEISSGYFFEDCGEEGSPVVSYEYTSDDGSLYLTIEQWGERSFEVSLGKEVFDYQFTNFLPGAK
jgi:hypothetical protein